MLKWEELELEIMDNVNDQFTRSEFETSLNDN